MNLAFLAHDKKKELMVQFQKQKDKWLLNVLVKNQMNLFFFFVHVLVELVLI